MEVVFSTYGYSTWTVNLSERLFNILPIEFVVQQIFTASILFGF